MIWLYRLLYLPLYLFLSFRFRRKRKGRPIFKERWRHLLGNYCHLPVKNRAKRIWVHAVSLGELKVALAFVEKACKLWKAEFFISTTTSTGYAFLLKSIEDKKNIYGGFFPLDTWPTSALGWFRVQPDGCVLVEGELWPEHIRQANRKKVPIWLINARMSERSYARYQSAPFLARWQYGRLTGIATSCQKTTHQFSSLGLLEAVCVRYAGQIKSDIAKKPRMHTDARNARCAQLGFDAYKKGFTVLLGLSIWPGEELGLMQAFLECRRKDATVGMVWIPRHPERLDSYLKTLRAHGVRAERWSVIKTSKKVPSLLECVLVDTLGECEDFLSLADVVYVGKSSFGHIGGQSPIEPVAFGCATVIGPSFSNFSEVVESMQKKGAIKVASGFEDMVNLLVEHILCVKTRAQMEKSAGLWAEGHQGVVTNLITMLTPSMCRSETCKA